MPGRMRKRDYLLAPLIIAGLYIMLSGFVNPEAAHAFVQDPIHSANYAQKMWDFFTSTGQFVNEDQLAIPGLEAGTLAEAELATEAVALTVTMPEVIIAAAGVAITLSIISGRGTQIFHLFGNSAQVGTVPTAAHISYHSLCMAGISTSCVGNVGHSGTFPGMLQAKLPATDPYVVANGVNGYALVAFKFDVTCAAAFPQASATVGGITVIPTGNTTGGSTTINANACFTSALAAENALIGQGIGTVVTLPNSEGNTAGLGLSCDQFAGQMAWTGSGTCPNYSGTYSALALNEKQLEDLLLHSLPCASTTTGCTASTNAGSATKTLSPALTSAPDNAALDRGRAVIDAATNNALGYGNCTLDPSEYTCPGTAQSGKPFLLPKVADQETYQSYTQRLRDLGYLGSVVLVNDAMTQTAGSAARALNPTDITGVSVGVYGLPATVPLYDPVTGVPIAWPVNAPLVVPGSTTEIDIQKVPDSYTGGSGGGGGNPPPTDACGVSEPNLNMTPLTSLNFGSRFPFGVFTWISSFLGTFNVSPVTPEFNFNLSGAGASIGYSGSLVYDVKLNAFDSYMTTIRSLISYALWIGAIWYVGSALLGFRAGGDMTEAADAGLGDEGG